MYQVSESCLLQLTLSVRRELLHSLSTGETISYFLSSLLSVILFGVEKAGASYHI